VRFIIFCISLTCIFAGCKKEKNQLIDPPTFISFSIEKINSGNNFISETKQFSFKEKLERWNVDTTDELSRLSRDVIYDVELNNEEIVELRFNFYKREELNIEDLILEEQDNEESVFGEKGYKWSYKNFDVEFENFYQIPENFKIEFGGYDVSTNSNIINVQDINLKKAIVNGEERVYADFNFEWEAFGAFDPNKEYEGYIVTNESFKGLID